MDKGSYEAIREWSERKALDVVVWTDLESNFSEKKKEPFSVDAAIVHIQGLDAGGKKKATEYVRRAPRFVRTPLRSALEGLPWFSKV